jgi:hypothetical protein
VAQGSVDGVNQIETRVDQGAIQIEDDQFYGVRIKGTVDANHQFSE